MSAPLQLPATTAAVLRVASFDFGPVHTSLCLAEVCPVRRVVTRILDWKVLDWRRIALRACGRPSSSSSSSPLCEEEQEEEEEKRAAAGPKKPIDAMTVAELRALCAAWEGGSGTDGLKRPQLVARAKKLRKVHFPKIKSTFFSSYGKYTEMIFRELNAALELDRPDVPLDVVLLEHQPANFRYENAVVESMIAQHIVTMTRLPSRTVPPAQMHFLSPAFKFRAFLGLVPRTASAAAAATDKKRRKKSRTAANTQHAANKRFSIDCCQSALSGACPVTSATLTEEAAGPALAAFLSWEEEGRKVDDLADVLIQIVSALHVPPSRKRARVPSRDDDNIEHGE